MLLNNKTIAILLFSTLILYKIIGVAIHSQYGFGFYYWIVQLFLLFILSFVYLIKNNREVKHIFTYNSFLYHLYFWVLLLFQCVYIMAVPDSSYLSLDTKLSIFSETLAWYIVFLALILNFRRIVLLMNQNVMLVLYTVVVFFFFLLLFHIQNNYVTALIMGITFPPALRDVLPGYSWGFHLFFSPYFSIFSFSIIVILRKNRKYFLSYSIAIISLYVLFLAGGRGTLLSFFIILFLFLFSKKAKIVAMFFMFLILAGASTMAEIFSDNERMYKLLTFQLGEDGSGRGRAKILNENLKLMEDNYIFGSLYSYFDGDYIHNILSVLQDYGIIVFSILIIIIIHGSYIFLSKTKILKNDIAFQIAKLVFFFSVIENIFFKYSTPISYILPMLTMYGYILLYLKSKYFRNKYNIKPIVMKN